MRTGSGLGKTVARTVTGKQKKNRVDVEPHAPSGGQGVPNSEPVQRRKGNSNSVHVGEREGGSNPEHVTPVVRKEAWGG
eukprot:3581035-Rhodomonas_salina.1